ncbi:MAG TPA: 2-isopropylmalate synthase [Terriglobales bacterium]|nr:2-isopropylmalate synthase [Terriglobales bacterium]
MQRARVQIFDTTLRDGEQSPGCSMNLDEKVRMARQLDVLGADIIEGGFPIASDGDFESVRAIAEEIKRPKVAGLARCTPMDIERAYEAVKVAAHPRIHVFLATSDIHLHYKLKISRQQCLEQAVQAVKFARSLCEDIEFSAEDATRTDLDFLCDVSEAVAEAGASTVNLPDTVGFSLPSDMTRIISAACARTRKYGTVLSTHCHNDLGLAVANSIAAIEGGARQVECTINGIGERAGNAALEEIVMTLRVRADMLPYDTGIVSEQLYPTSRLLTEMTGVHVQANKAIVGRNAFAHEAGIHQDGVIKNPLTYEIMAPKSVGVPENKLVLGKHSGRAALGFRCGQLGYSFDRRQLDSVYKKFVTLADQIKVVEDRHLLAIIREEFPTLGMPVEAATTAAVSTSMGRA